MHALAFSDYHFHIWKSFNTKNSRTKYQLDLFEDLMKKAFTLKVPIFFSGDLFHTPDGLSNSLLSLVLPRLIQIFNIYPVDFYAVTGNHEFEGFNSYSKRSPSYINTLANSIERFHVLDFETRIVGDMAVHGIPYINFNQDYRDIIEGIKIVPGKFNILLNHCDYKGQKDTNGIVIGRGENITKGMFKKFDLVLSGHVHKKGHLFGNVYSVGAPFQQRVSDMGGSFGYWTLKKDFKLEFHEINGPQFRYYEKESEIENDFDYWVKKPNPGPIEEQVEFDTSSLGDKGGIIKAYLGSINNKSRTKAAVLYDLLGELEDD